jgi:hypothetical protein
MLGSDVVAAVSPADFETSGAGVDARRDSRLRTAALTESERPVLTRAARYNWNATSERNSGEPGSCNNKKTSILNMKYAGMRRLNEFAHPLPSGRDQIRPSLRFSIYQGIEQCKLLGHIIRS